MMCQGALASLGFDTTPETAAAVFTVRSKYVEVVGTVLQLIQFSIADSI